MTNEEILQAVESELNKRLEPLLQQLEKLKQGSETEPPKEESPAEAWFKAKEYEAEHHTGKSLDGVLPTDGTTEEEKGKTI